MPKLQDIAISKKMGADTRVTSAHTAHSLKTHCVSTGRGNTDNAFEQGLLRVAFYNAMDGMIIIDRHHRIVHFNQEAERLTGLREDVALGSRCCEVLSCGDGATKHLRGLGCPLQVGTKVRDYPLRHIFTNRNNQRLSVDITHVPLPHGTSEHSYQLVVLRRCSSKRAKQINYDMIAAASHELISPLNLIRGYATTISNLDAALSADQRKRYLQAIEFSALRLTQLLRNYLELPRLESQSLYLSLEPANLTKLVRNSVTQMQMQSVDNVIKLRSSRGLPEVNIDSEKIEQVMTNLLINAIKYSPPGNDIRVSVQWLCNNRDLMKISGGQRRVSLPCQVVRIQDTGIGIPENDLGLVFEKYYRVNNPINPTREGMGLGLYLCKVIIEAHGGDIWIRSNTGNGCTVYFTVPVDKQVSRR